MKRRNIESKLTPWQESDGEHIHLAALRQALPGHRWDLYLIGTTGAGSNKKPAKVLPILGRMRINAVVVLLSSMRDWLTHYNPNKPAVVESMIEDLRQSERDYLANLNLIRAEVRLKSGETPGRKPSPPKPKQAKPLKVTSKEVFGVWK